MSRPGGVTASAVVAIIGSAFVLLMGGIVVVGLAASSASTPRGVSVITAVIGVIVVAFAGLGIWTGLALLKLRPWARISTLVFAGFMSVVSLLVIVVMTLIPTPPLPDAQQNVAVDAMRPFVTGVYAILLAIGVWCLIYFNRADTKAAFAAPYEPGGPPLRPLSISIIGWVSVIGGASVIVVALMRLPMFVAGLVLTGWTASIAYLVLGGLSLCLGWAVLTLKEAGRKGMIVWYGVTMAHSMYVSLVPSVRARMLDLQRSMPFAAPSSPAFDTMLIAIGVMFGVALGAVAIWFLVKERPRFQ